MSSQRLSKSFAQAALVAQRSALASKGWIDGIHCMPDLDGHSGYSSAPAREPLTLADSVFTGR
jgi:hypothetical protein